MAIMAPPPEPSHPLLEQYINLLQDEDIDFVASEAGNALMIYGESAAGHCEGFIMIEELEAEEVDATQINEPVRMDFCEVAYILPLESAPDILPLALYELIVRLNESHRIGAYELHIEERELRFRIYQTFDHQTPITRERLLMPLYEGIRAINLHWDCFKMVLEEGHDPTHAIAEYFANTALDDEEGLDEELLERANDMFELASKRYASRRDDERAAILKTRLQRLTEEVSMSIIRDF